MEANNCSSFLDDSTVFQTRRSDNGQALEKVIRRFEETPEEITPEGLNELNNALSFILLDIKKLRKFDKEESDPLFKKYSSLASKVKTLYYVHQERFDDAIDGIELLPTKDILKRQLQYIGLDIQ